MVLATERALDRSSLRDQALAVIRNALVSGQIRPGRVVSAATLAGELRVSNSPVREAMLALVAGGFTIWEVIWRGMRIRLAPDHLLGRVTSILRWLEMAPFPLASLLGGALVVLGTALGGRTLGLRLPYLLTAAVFVLLGVALYPLASPRRFWAAEAAAAQERRH